MSEIDRDLQSRLKQLADEIKPDGAREPRILDGSRVKRRLVAMTSGLTVLLLIGGIAGASMLWQPHGISRAPADRSGCQWASHDLAVFIEDSATEEEVEKLGADLVADNEVQDALFFSKEEAFEEFKENYRDQPEFWENLPRDALPMSFRVTLIEGADLRAAARRFKNLAAVDEVRLAEEMAQSAESSDGCRAESTRVFARYFFEAAKKNTSASGAIEVNSKEGTLCLEPTLSDDITASHLLWRPEAPDDDPQMPEVIAATFIDPDGDEAGKASFRRFPICLREEQLGALRGEFEGEELQTLIDHPEQFRIDFHRGPNDEPGLVAKLRRSPVQQLRADYYIEESRGFGVHLPEGWDVARQSLTPTLGDPREILSLGTAAMRPGGGCAHQPVRALEALGPTDAFISIQERRGDAGHPARPPSFREPLEDRVFNIELCTSADHFTPYWFAFRDAGRDLYLLAALGTDASSERTREFWDVLDSLDFEAPYGDNRST